MALQSALQSALRSALTNGFHGALHGATRHYLSLQVATLVAVFGPVTGCGMNPARDLGPQARSEAPSWQQ